MGNIVKMYPNNAADKPDLVLEQAIGEYDGVIIIGYDHGGVMDVRASTNISHQDVLWLIQKFQFELLAGRYSEGDG